MPIIGGSYDPTKYRHNVIQREVAEKEAPHNTAPAIPAQPSFNIPQIDQALTDKGLDINKLDLVLGRGTNTVGITAEGVASTSVRIFAGSEYKDRAGAPFRVTAAGALFASNATIAGAISASTIDIGGSDSTSFHVDIDGNMWLGAATFAAATFSVSNAGSITATSGAIAGWNIISGYIYSLTSGTPTSSPSGGIVMASTNPVIIAYEGTDKRLELGYLSSGVFGLKGYATDGATTIFELSNTNQKIASWNFTDTVLRTGATDAASNVLIDAANSLIRLGPTSGNYITVDGANQRIRSSNYVTGVSGMNLDPTLVEAENLVARGIMRGSTFMYDVISAVGGQIIVANADTLASDMTALDASTLTTRGSTTWAANDIIVIRAVTALGIQEEWLRITSAASAPTYTVTRDLASSFAADTNPIWKAGTTISKQGKSDGAATYSGGWLRLFGEGTNSPYYSVFSRTGVAYNAYTEQVRLGNLNGFLDYATDIFGFAVGSSSGSSPNVTIDPTNGLRIRYGTTAVASITASGGVSVIATNLDTTDYTYGETISQYDALYIDDTDSYKLKKITSTVATWGKFLGIAMESGSNNDTGKRVRVKGLISNGSFPAVQPTFSQGTGGNNWDMNRDTSPNPQDSAFGHQFDNTGPEAQCTGGTIRIKKTGTPAEDVYIRLCFANSGGVGLPNWYLQTLSGNGSFATATISSASISTSYADVTFTFASAVRIPANCTFWLVVSKTADSGDAANYYTVESNSAGRPTYWTDLVGGSGPVRWVSAQASSLRCALTMSSISQTGYGIRLYNGTTAGTTSTGASGMHPWSRVVGQVLSTSSWYLNPKSEYSATGNFSQVNNTTVGNLFQNITTGFRPSHLDIQCTHFLDITTDRLYCNIGYCNYQSGGVTDLTAIGSCMDMSGNSTDKTTSFLGRTSSYRYFFYPKENGFYFIVQLNNDGVSDPVSAGFAGYGEDTIQMAWVASQK